MHLRHHGWEYVVKTKTKRSTAISVLRWILLRHVTQSLDQINDENTKKNALWEEMHWLNQYWAQPIPKSTFRYVPKRKIANRIEEEEHNNDDDGEENIKSVTFN
ncbi:unnamed protein product [Rotaria socialis]